MLIKDTFYAAEWMDETPGVSGDLAQVAGQMVNGVQHDPGEWIVPPQEVPSSHKAIHVQYAYVPCPMIVPGTYQIPEELPGEVHAMAFFEGGGWTPEMMAVDREEAQALLNEWGDQETEYLVCLVKEQDGHLHLKPGPVAVFEPMGKGGQGCDSCHTPHHNP